MRRQKPGRPVESFAVKLTETEATANLHSSSERRQIVDWLREQPRRWATIEQIERRFSNFPNVRAVVSKLMLVHWVARAELSMRGGRRDLRAR